MSSQSSQHRFTEEFIAAIDNPTRENVELYVYLQKMAMDKGGKIRHYVPSCPMSRLIRIDQAHK